MRHEKIFKREDGSQVKIGVTLSASWTQSTCSWDITVSTCEPKKRTWKGTHSGDDYNYRKLSQQERISFIQDSQLKHVTAAEIQEVKLELWQKMKP